MLIMLVTSHLLTIREIQAVILKVIDDLYQYTIHSITENIQRNNIKKTNQAVAALANALLT